MDRPLHAPRWHPPGPAVGLPILVAALVAAAGLVVLGTRPPGLRLEPEPLAPRADPVLPVDALGVAHHDFAFVEGREVVLERVMYGSHKTVWESGFQGDIALSGAMDVTGNGFDALCLSVTDSGGASAIIIDRDGQRIARIGPIGVLGAARARLVVDLPLAQDGHRRLLCRLVPAVPGPGRVGLFDLESGAELWDLALAATPLETRLADLDGNGRPEFLVATGRPAGSSAPCEVLALTERGGLMWRDSLADGAASAAVAALAPAARHGGVLVVATTRPTAPAADGPGRIAVLDGPTGRELARHVFPRGLGEPAPLGGPGQRVVAGSRDGRLRVLSPRLEVLAERAFDGPVEVRACADLNRDGTTEIVAATRREVVVLDERLQVRARLATGAHGQAPLDVRLASAGLGNMRLSVAGEPAVVADVRTVPPLAQPAAVALVLGVAVAGGVGARLAQGPRRRTGLPAGAQAREFLLDYHQIRHETFGRERPFARVRLWAQAQVAGHPLPAEVLESASDEFRRLGTPTLLRFGQRAGGLGVERTAVRRIRELTHRVAVALDQACRAPGGQVQGVVEGALATMTELSGVCHAAYREVALRDVCRPDHEAQEAILAKRSVLDQHGVALAFSLDPSGKQAVLFDSSELRALAGELIENAARALAGQPRPEIAVTIAGNPGDARWVELRVADNGPGIPPERRDALFAPGASSHPEGGFGLHRAREIAQRWLADLAVEDPPSGRGAVVRLSLRALLPHDAVAAEAAVGRPPVEDE